MHVGVGTDPDVHSLVIYSVQALEMNGLFDCTDAPRCENARHADFVCSEDRPDRASINDCRESGFPCKDNENEYLIYTAGLSPGNLVDVDIDKAQDAFHGRRA